MRILVIVLPLLFFGLVLALSVRDVLRFVRNPGAAKSPALVDRYLKITPGYVALVLALGAGLAVCLYLFGSIQTGQAVGLGASVAIVGMWRKARLNFVVHLFRKWLPPAPAEGFPDDKARLDWENRRADIMLKMLPKIAMIFIASDLALIGGILLFLISTGSFQKI